MPELSPSADDLARSPPPRSRILLLCLGWIFFALGVVGVLLPIVPTTPFMLLALWAFSKSSRRFHQWLWHHRIFGPPIRRWHQDHAIPLWAKILALASMTASLAYVGFVTQPPGYALAAMAVVVAAGAAYVLRLPTARR